MKITGFDDVLQFREFELKKEAGEHSICRFSFVSSQFDTYADYVNRVVKIVEDDHYLLTGKVTSVAFQAGNTEDIITVTVHSLSFDNDEVRKTRIFHEKGQKYGDIAKQISELGSLQIRVSKKMKEAACDVPVVQMNETDFAFIKRISGMGYNDMAYVADTEETSSYYIGARDDGERRIERGELSSLTRYKEKNKEGVCFSIAGGIQAMELRQYVDLGKKVTVNAQTYVLNKVAVKKARGVYRYECTAERATKEAPENSRKEKGSVLFHAKVADTADPDHMGRVRLDFAGNGIEDRSENEKMWVDVLTPYTAGDGGFVFIPDQGDAVEVLWDGTVFFVIGSRRCRALHERYQDVGLKQIGNRYEKNICFAEDQLEITSKNTKVVITDEAVLVETEKSNVSLDQDLTLCASKVHVDADEMENNIKKKYTCESKDVKINASSVVNIEGGTKVSIN